MFKSIKNHIKIIKKKLKAPFQKHKNESKIKVSIIIPIYNGEKYLEECLNSLINQTLKDIEIICIDDYSNDKSLKILKDFQENDKRIKIIKNIENFGGGESRNKGLEQAQGQYIGFVDADDYVEFDFYKKLYNKAIEENADIVRGYERRISEDNDKITVHKGSTMFKHKHKKLHRWVVWDKIYRNSLLKKHNIKFFNNSCLQDGPFSLKAFYYANKLRVAEDTFYIHRIQADSIRKTMNIKKFFDEFKSFELIINFINSVNFNTEDYLFNFKRIIRELDLAYDKFWRLTSPSSEELEKYIQKVMNFYHQCKYRNLLYKKYYKPYFDFFEKKDIEGYIDYSKSQHIELLRIKQNELIESFEEDIKNFNGIGLNSNNINHRNKKLIISLTSFPPRMNDIHYCLFSLLNQSLKPDKLILWLAEEQFPNKEKDIPEKVLELKKYGLEIKFCNDIKSYKKLIPTLKEFPNDIIITADDDVYYPQNWLELLYESWQKEPEFIHCHRAHKIMFDNNKILSYQANCKGSHHANFLNFFTGCGGVLYPNNCFYKDISREDLFMELCPNADDIWFFAMVVLNNTKIKVVKNNIKKLTHVNLLRSKGFTDDHILMKLNVHGNQNDIQLHNVFNHYKDLEAKLKSNLC